MAGSDHDRALAAAGQHYRCCKLCEHRCGVDRYVGERGFCKALVTAHVFRHRLEYGEELELIPSHLFYLSGCDLRCAFCIAENNAFDPGRGVPLTAEFLRDAVSWGQARGSRTLQWVGGEPTIHIPAILQAMSGCSALPPVVWKSDFYGTPEAFELLAGFVDIYVADFKFGNDACARRIAGVDNYLAIVTRNLRLAAAQAELIVRHLLLPGHFDCCYRPLVAWLAANMPEAKFSLREGYLPRWRAKRHVELAGALPAQAAAQARTYARHANLQLVT
jgi:putative pyruvate formate lyase activating enzyme